MKTQRHGTLPASEITEVPTDQVLIDPIYQRALDEQRIAYMANHWQPDLFGVPVVNKRKNGNLYVVDGQHRVAALNRMDTWPERIRVELFKGLSLEQEAYLFWKLDTRRRSLNAVDAYRAALVAKDPEALGVDKAVRAAGAKIGRADAAPGMVRCVTVVTEIYRRSGAGRVTDVLGICLEAWPNDPGFALYPIVQGVDGMLEQFTLIDRKRLVLRLMAADPHTLVARIRAMGGGIGASTTREAATATLMGLYNTGLRTRKLA